MTDIYAIFVIPGVSLYNDDEGSFEGIKQTVLTAMRNRIAVFDKYFIVDDDDVENDHDDYDSHSDKIETRVDVSLKLTDDLMQRIDHEEDLIFRLAISELETQHHISRNWQRDQVTYLGFEKHGM